MADSDIAEHAVSLKAHLYVLNDRKWEDLGNGYAHFQRIQGKIGVKSWLCFAPANPGPDVLTTTHAAATGTLVLAHVISSKANRMVPQEGSARTLNLTAKDSLVSSDTFGFFAFKFKKAVAAEAFAGAHEAHRLSNVDASVQIAAKKRVSRMQSKSMAIPAKQVRREVLNRKLPFHKKRAVSVTPVESIPAPALPTNPAPGLPQLALVTAPVEDVVDDVVDDTASGQPRHAEYSNHTDGHSVKVMSPKGATPATVKRHSRMGLAKKKKGKHGKKVAFQDQPEQKTKARVLNLMEDDSDEDDEDPNKAPGSDDSDDEPQLSMTEEVRTFPRRRLNRYRRGKVPSLQPIPPSADDKSLHSRYRVLVAMKELLKMEKNDLKRLVQKSKDEKQGLEKLCQPEILRAVKMDSSVRSAVIRGVETLSYVNNQLQQHCTSVRVENESIQRSMQFADVDPARSGMDDSVRRSLTILQHSSENSVQQDQKNRTHRFRVLKVNKLRKDTPRVMELDLTAKVVTVFKKTNDESDFATDFKIKSVELIDYNLLDKRKDNTLFSLTYRIPGKIDANGKQKKDEVKEWKVIFSSMGERHRFYNLTQLYVARNSDWKKNNASISSYKPKKLVITPNVDKFLRQYPTQMLAENLHVFWTLFRKERGWKYGKLENEDRKTHPHLIAYKQLPSSRKRSYAITVNQCLALVIDNGFAVSKPSDTGFKASHGTICPALIQLLELFAELVHDTWAEEQFKNGWSYGSPKNLIAKENPSMRPYSTLEKKTQKRTRNVVLKLLGSLVDGGYSIDLEEPY